MKKYPNYKYSGVEWIGNIPIEWNVGKLKFLSRIKRGASPRPIDDLKYFDDENGEYYWIRINDLTKSGRYLYNTEQKLSELGSSLSYKLNAEELVMSISGSVGKVIITKAKCCIHDGFVVFQDLKLNRDYLFYILTNPNLYNEDGKLGTQFNINSDIAGNKFVPIFSEIEQFQIVTFLDQKTSIIDDLIQKKHRKIELLKEQRTSIINQTVTKGLDPGVRMKESGIEWIGEIPEHWKKTKLKLNFKSTGGGTPSKEVKEYWNGNIPWVSPKDMKSKYIDSSEDKITQIGLENSATNLIKESSLLIVVRSGILQRTIPIGINTVPVTINQDLKSLQAVSGDSVYFLYYFVKGNEENLLKEWSKVGATVESIEMEFMNNSKIPFPFVPEQLQIVEYLDKKTSEIDKQVDLENRKIELLKEYRQSMISEVVTGKIDVRTN